MFILCFAWQNQNRYLSLYLVKTKQWVNGCNLQGVWELRGVFRRLGHRLWNIKTSAAMMMFFAERLGWWRKTTERSRRNCHRLYYQDRIEVSELSVLMQTETMAMQCTAVQIDNLAFDNVLPFLNVSVCSLTRNCWTITLGWIVLKNCMLCLQLWGQLFKIWLISVWVLSTYLQ